MVFLDFFTEPKLQLLSMTAPITDEIWYELGNTDRVKELEQAMVSELTELKNELEENEMVHGISKPVRYKLFIALLLELQ